VGRLKIAAAGDTPQLQNHRRGKLFEDLMTKVLRHYGYSIGRIANVNYAGMEIDIEGESLITEIPLYAECKAYDNDVDSPKFQQFFGKFMTRWLKDSRSTGLFIAIPGINSHAKGFYSTTRETTPNVSVRLLEEPEVLDAIFNSDVVVRSDSIERRIPSELGTPGDWLLLYTDRGIFWIQYVIPIGSGVAQKIAIFDGKGQPITERSTLDYLLELESDLADFSVLDLQSNAPAMQPTFLDDPEEVVEVQGSSACFEYQFPASPAHFVGRETVLGEIDNLASNILLR
jgi:hypothetical protein